MTKHKQEQVEPIIQDEIDPVIETVEQKAIVPDVKAEVRREFWEVVTWKGVKDVLRCKNCGHNEDDKDRMILHVITHFPASEQNKLFDKLVKEY